MAAGLAVSLVPCSHADVTLTRVDYHGWKGAYRLSNRRVELVYVPQIGRVMRYGFIHGPNVLWNNPALYDKTVDLAHPPKDWTNFGGDKLWPAPQDAWGWPPDPAIDPGRQTVRVLQGNRLQVTGGPSKKHNIRFVREIALDTTGTGVTLRNTMENVSDETVNWSVWEVTQVDRPSEVVLPLSLTGRFNGGYRTFKDNAPAEMMWRIIGSRLHLRRDVKRTFKVGTDSRLGWIRMNARGLGFAVFAPLERGATYPDGGCAQEVYSNPDPLPYMEMELLGPVRSLAPLQKTTFVTRWMLKLTATKQSPRP